MAQVSKLKNLTWELEARFRLFATLIEKHSSNLSSFERTVTETILPEPPAGDALSWSTTYLYYFTSCILISQCSIQILLLSIMTQGLHRGFSIPLAPRLCQALSILPCTASTSRNECR
jgi:hypothetical protein